MVIFSIVILASLVSLIVINHGILRVVKLAFVKIDSTLYKAFVLPFENYSYGAVSSFWAYCLIYLVITMIAALFGMLMYFVLPDEEKEEGETFMKKTTVERLKTTWPRLLMVLFMTPVQTYATWNVGSYYITG